MGELKFSCPHCSQHISCGAEWGGVQIKCPACQNDITIPQAAPASAAVRVSVPASHSPQPPMRSSAPPPPPSAPAAPPLPPAAAPPLPRSGLVVAREAPPPPPQVQTSPSPAQPVGGQGNGAVQWAGLIGAFLVTAIIIGMAATWKPPERKGDLVFVREKRGRKYVVVAKSRDTASQKSDPAASDDSEEKSEASSAPTTNVAPGKPQWTLDLQAAQIPDAQANGQISGGPFTAERALLQRTPSGYLLMVRQGAGPQIERELWVSLPLKPGEKLDGNSWNITEATTATAPRVIKRWLQNARQQTKTFTNGYAMKLEFAQTQSNALPAKLFIALPDEEKSFVAGTLKASFLVAAAPAPQPSLQQQPQRPPQQQQQQQQQQQRRLPRMTY